MENPRAEISLEEAAKLMMRAQSLAMRLAILYPLGGSWQDCCTDSKADNNTEDGERQSGMVVLKLYFRIFKAPLF